MSVVQEFKSDLPGWFWLRASHLVSAKMLARAVVIWMFDWGWGSVSKMIHSFGYWQKTLVFAFGPLHRAACTSSPGSFLSKQGIQVSKMKALMSFQSNMGSHNSSCLQHPIYWLYKSALFIVGRDYTKTWITRRSSWEISTRFQSWDVQNRWW